MSEFSPSTLMRRLRNQLGLSVEEFTSAISHFHPKEVSLETVNGWLNHDQPVGVRHRKAFFAFLNRYLEQDDARKYEGELQTAWQSHAERIRHYDSIFKRHHKWIETRYKRPIPGESFGLGEVYVPIRMTAYGMRKGIEEMDQVFTDDDIKKFALHGFKDSKRTVDQQADWLFIKGGPGSGKSALAITIAHQLTKLRSSYALFLRGSSLAGVKSAEFPSGKGAIGDSYEFSAFVDQFKKSLRKHLSVIIDGLDEIGTDSRQNQTDILAIIENMRQQLNLLADHGKSFKVVVLGRDTLTEITSRSFKSETRLLEMGDLSGAMGPYREFSHCYDEDRRPDWWFRFARARGIASGEEVPKLFTDVTHPLFQVCREPLLAFLLVRTAWPPIVSEIVDVAEAAECVDAYSANKSRNEIYADIIDKIRSGKDWKEDLGEFVSADDFIQLLRHMALAAWHNGTLRAVSVEGIRQAIQDEKTQRAFEQLLVQLDGEDSTTLLTAFYYRFQDQHYEQGRAFNTADFEIEFTHKTFAEYLLATFLFDQAETLLDSHLSKKSEAELAAVQQRFVSYAMAGELSREINSFLLDEARIRFGNRDWNDWRQLREVCQSVECLKTLDANEPSPWLRQVTSLDRLKRACELIALVWGCLNQVHFASTGDRSTLEEDEFAFSDYDVLSYASVASVETQAEIGELALVTPETPTATILSATHAHQVSFPGLYMSTGALFSSEFSEVVFEGLIWNEVTIKQTSFLNCPMQRGRHNQLSFNTAKLTNCNLRQSVLHDTFFHGSELEAVRFEQSEFLQVHFVDCVLTATWFARSDFKDCEFVGCKLVSCDFEAALFNDTVFKDCVFEGGRADESQFSSAEFENCEGHETLI